MEKSQLTDYRNYLWDYFVQHAEQRLKSFNFFLLASAVLVGAFVNTVKDGHVYKLSAIILFFLSIVSFLFWKLDERTKQMIKNAEDGIKYIDGRLLPDFLKESPLNIFSYDDKQQEERKVEDIEGFFKRNYTYSKCFKCMFVIFGVGGLLSGMIVLIFGS